MTLVEQELQRMYSRETVLVWDRLEVGDEVAYMNGQHSFYGTTVKMHTVERLTATQIVMTDGSKWYRKNGQQVAAQSSEALRHPMDDAVIDSLLGQEHRAFKRALEELCKPKTTGDYKKLLEHRNLVEKLAQRFGARVFLLEGKRRAAV